MIRRKVAVRGAESPFFDFLKLTSDSRENLFETPSRVGRYMLESVLPPFERAKMILQAVTPTARDPAAMQDHERSALRSEEHTSELQSPCNLVCRLLLEKKKKKKHTRVNSTR